MYAAQITYNWTSSLTVHQIFHQSKSFQLLCSLYGLNEFIKYGIH